MRLIDLRSDDYDAPEGDSGRYPPGLRLVLEDDTLERLGIDHVSVGDEVRLSAIAKCVAYTESARDDDGVALRLELQITELGVAEDPGAARARRDDDRLNQLGGAS